jgi:hypothetical protein
VHQIPSCKNCGAPLSGAPGQLSVQCSYCGTNHHLAAPAALPAHAAPSPAPPSRKALAVVAISIALGLLIAFMVVRLSVGTGSGVSAGAGVNTSFRLGANTFGSTFLEWYTPTCLVDANGDGALDVAGLAAAPGSQRWKLHLVDGLTGNVLWSEKEYKPVNGIVCLSPHFFGLEADDFRLQLFPAKKLDSPLTIPLSDHIDQLGAGDGCVLIKTRDGAQKSVSLTAGPVGQCNAPGLGDPWGNWGINEGSTDSGVERVSAGKTFLLSYRNPGTPFLTLTARAQGQQLWTQSLSAIKPNSGLAFAVTPGMLVVYGVDPKDDDFGVVIGVDPETGAQRYAVRQDSSNSADFRSFHFSGKLVLIDWGFGLHAYDPADGRRVWHIGGR